MNFRAREGRHNMAQLYKVDRHVLGHLDSNEFRIDTRVSIKEIKKRLFQYDRF